MNSETREDVAEEAARLLKGITDTYPRNQDVARLAYAVRGLLAEREQVRAALKEVVEEMNERADWSEELPNTLKTWADRLSALNGAGQTPANWMKKDACDRCDPQTSRACFHYGCQRYDRHDAVLNGAGQ